MTLTAKDEKFMRIAIEKAEKAMEKGNEPFGAILVKDDEIVSSCENQIFTKNDPTFHAELGLIKEFCSANGGDLSEYTMYTSCEPCCMCSGAMVWSKLGRVVYSLNHEELAEIAGFNIMIGSDEIFASSPFKPSVGKQVLSEESRVLYEDYFWNE